MPVCKHCGHMAASSEMRRYLNTYKCIDKWACKLRKKTK